MDSPISPPEKSPPAESSAVPANPQPAEVAQTQPASDKASIATGEQTEPDSAIVRPAPDHFKITPGEIQAPLKRPSLFTPKGVSSWYQINHRAAKAGLIAAIAALLMGSGLTYLALRFGKKPAPTQGFNPQGLDNNSLQKLSTDQLGTSKPGQTLTILADSKFKNDLSVGGKSNLHAVNIDGASALQGGANVQNYLNVTGILNVGGATNLNGSLSVTGSLNTGGNGSFGGVLSVNTVTAKSLITSGGLTLGGHLLTGGPAPGASAGPAAGGGSVTISGNDTSGTVTIVTGSTPFAGQLATVNFRTAFAATPRVILTAVGPSSARLQPYNSRSVNFFTVESLNKPEPGTSYSFDYFVSQ